MDKVIALTRDLYIQAQEKGVTVSQLLEQMNPNNGDSKLTAFQRALKQENILTKSAPAKGFSADRVEAFYRTEESKILFPEYIGTTVREALQMQSILPYLTTNLTTIDSNAYRVAYIDYGETGLDNNDKTGKQNKEASKRRRVTEAAELPVAKIRHREQAVTIYKYGLAIQASYEAIRRMKIDLLSRHVQFIGTQIGWDEVAEIMDVLLSGDGNKGTAAKQYKLTDLDPGATKLTRQAWLAFLLKFFPYGADTVVGNETAALQLLDMMAPENMNQIMSTLSANGSIQLAVSFPQGLFRQVDFLLYPDTPMVNGHNALFALARDYAVEKVQEAGSDISEADKFITNQTSVLTVSENAGFASMYPQASKILELA